MSGNPGARRPPGSRGGGRPPSVREGSWQPRRYLQTSPENVAGDVVLSAETTSPATPDLSKASAARLGGRAIAMAGLVVVAGIVLSRLLGWVRTSVFLSEYGTSADLDAFWAAFRIPDTLFQLVAAGAVGSALVPVASALLARGEEQRARRVVATVANLMLIVLIPLAVVVWFAAPTLVPIIDPSAGAGKLALEITLTRWMLLSPILLAIAAVMTAGLNASGVFGAPALAPNVYNIAIIVCALALTPAMGVYALALGVVIGAAGHVATQARAVRQNGLYSLVLDWHDPAVRETLLLMAPRALGLGATQIVFLVNTYFALQMPGHGALTVYTGAFTALQIPVGLIGVPLGIILLPPLSQAIARGDMERFRSLVERSLRLLLYAAIPLTGLMLVLATPAMQLLYQRGAFRPEDTAATIPVFLVFLVGLVAHVLISLLAPIFYAGKDTRTPVAAVLLAVAVDVAAAAVLFPLFQLNGLALAIGLGAWAEVSMLFLMMRRRQGFDLRPLGLTVAFALPGASLAAAAALATDRLVANFTHNSTSLPILVVDLGLAGLIGLAVYLAWGRLLRLPELATVTDIARTLMRRGS